jgi:hypothetical protein
VSHDFAYFARLFQLGHYLAAEWDIQVEAIWRSAAPGDGVIQLELTGQLLHYIVTAEVDMEYLRLRIGDPDRLGAPRRVLDTSLNEAGFRLVSRLITAFERERFCDVKARPIVLGGGQGPEGWLIE